MFDKSLSLVPPSLQDSSSKFKATRFDVKTSKILKKLHYQTLKHANVDCVGKSQLVNDKVFLKEVRQLPSLALSHSEDEPKSPSSGTSDPVIQVRSTDDTIESSDTGLSSSHLPESFRGRNQNDAILCARSSSSDDASFRQKNNLLDRKKNASGSVSRRSPRGSPVSDSSFSWTNIQLQPSRNLPSPSSSGGTRKSPTSSAGGTDSKAGSGVPEWKNLQLRKVLLDNSNRLAEANDSRSSPKECVANALSETGVSDLSEFGKLLRPVRPSATKTSPALGTSGKFLEGDSAVYERPILLASALSIDGNSDGLRTHPPNNTLIAELETKSSEESSNQPSAEDTINYTASSSSASSNVLQNTATDPRQLIDDEAIMIRILGTPEIAVLGKETAWILVGRQMMMIVKKTGASGDSVAQVLWKRPRSDVPSLSLNMATLQVTLCCTGSESCEKILLFETSDDFLKFANAFYEQGQKSEDSANTSERPPSKPNDINVTLTSVTISDSSEQSLSIDGDSFRLDSLTDEEQTLLETYRQLRRAKGAKIALIEMIAAKDESEANKVPKTMTQRSLADNYEVSKKEAPDPIETTINSTVAPGSTLPRFVSTNGEASSPVSLLSHSVALSECEQAQVETYKRMLREKESLEEVRRKMEHNHVDPKVMAIVVSSDVAGVDVAQGLELTPAEDQIASSFRTMVKLKFPVEVIKHRMKKEEVSQKIIAAVLGNQENATASDASYAAALTAAEESVAATYRKMLQLGIEKDAVRHRMIKEEVEEKIMDAVVGKEMPTAVPLSSTSRKATTSEAKEVTNGLSLTAEEESMASNYRKMLKIQVPKDMVLSRMRQEGVSSKIIEAVFGQQSINIATGGLKEGATSGNKLVSLHWTPLSGKELDNSLWKVNSMLEDLDSQPERSDVSKLVSLFQKKTTQGKRKEVGAESDSSSTGKARLLDLTRSNNIAISLKAFKDFTFKELADIISFLDPLRQVTGERVLFLRDLLPTTAEQDMIRSFEGPDDRLLPAELWFRHLQHIKRIDTKALVMRTLETFHSELESLKENFRLLGQVCNQVMESDKLVFLLGKVLRIGNIMNAGTRTGGAAGFKFDSLLRLTQTKSADNKITVLDFLVTSLVDQGQREMLDLLADLPECQTASRLAIADLMSAAKELREGVTRCEEELQHLELELSGKSITTKKKFGSETGSGIVGASRPSNVGLLSEIMARGKSGDSVTKQEGFAQRDKFLAAIKENSSTIPQEAKPDSRGASSAATVALDPTEDQNSLKGGAARLERFVTDAKRMLIDLESNKADALSACSGFARYCGENGGTSSTSSLLGILATFAMNLHEALRKYDEKLEADSRKQRRRGDDSSTLCSDVASGSTIKSDQSDKASGKSLVLMVSDMLKVANERTKEDFKKGRTYENPSSTLKAIYELERPTVEAPSTQRSSVSPSGRLTRKLDIVSAIREQEGQVNDDEILQARSRFGAVKQPVDDKHTGDPEVSLANSDGLRRPSSSVEQPKSVEAEAPSSQENPTVADEVVPEVTISVKQARALFEEKLSSPIMPRPQINPRSSLVAPSKDIGDRRDSLYKQQTRPNELAADPISCTMPSPNLQDNPKEMSQVSSTTPTFVNSAQNLLPRSEVDSNRDGTMFADPAEVETMLLSKDVSAVNRQGRDRESSLFYVPLTEFPKSTAAPQPNSVVDVVDQKDRSQEVTSDQTLGRIVGGSVPIDSTILSSSLTAHSTPQSREKNKGSPALRLSDARKARVLFEKMIGRSPPPRAIPGRKSLSTPPSGSGKSTIANEPTRAAPSTPSPTTDTVAAPSIDLSGSKSRLCSKDSPITVPLEARQTSADSVDGKAAGRLSAGARTDSESTTPIRSHHKSSPASESKNPQPRKSLLDMAREKRLSRDSTSQTVNPPPLLPSAATAAATTTTPPPPRTGPRGGESPVLQLARQKREAKKDHNSQNNL